MLSVTRIVFSVALLATIGAGIHYFFYGEYALQKASVSSVQPAVDNKTVPIYKLTAVQLDEQDNRNIITCQQGSCQQLPPVEADGAAVTDGSYWYYFDSQKKNSALVKTDLISGETTPIVAQTKLTRPRGLHISPDNNQLAYWLDNVHQSRKKLTELWIYNAAEQRTELVAEKIVRPAVLSDIRWNKASSLTWFIGDTSEPGEKERIELLIASPNPSRITAAFPEIDWQEHQVIADTGIMDINSAGDSLAYVTKRFTRDQLMISRDGQARPTVTPRGKIVYVQWRDNDELLYIIQDRRGFSFWQTVGNIHRQIARRPGQLESLRGDNDGNHLVFAVKGEQRPRVYALDINSATITDQGPLPTVDSQTYVVQFEISNPIREIAGFTTDITEEERITFGNNHFEAITGAADLTPRAIMTTDEPSMIYLEYNDELNRSFRVLVTIHDLAHSEWSIQSRYQAKDSDWVRVDGGTIKDPPPTTRYEYETSIQKWVPKFDY